MNLNSLKDTPFRVYGDVKFRGTCPSESMEQMTFFNRVRAGYPNTWGMLAVHPRNEGLKSAGQFASVSRHRAEGMTPGAADIIIPGRIAFVCELKRRDATQSAWQSGQVEYLTAAHNARCFACVAFGCDAAWAAFGDWLNAI